VAGHVNMLASTQIATELLSWKSRLHKTSLRREDIRKIVFAYERWKAANMNGKG
jgi:hypothetical protein